MTVQGIKFTARTNELLLGFMMLVTAVFSGSSVSIRRPCTSRSAVFFLCGRSTIPQRSICELGRRELPLRHSYLSDSTECRSWPKR